MNEFGRVSICGCISQYNLEEEDLKGYNNKYVSHVSISYGYCIVHSCNYDMIVNTQF